MRARESAGKVASVAALALTVLTSGCGVEPSGIQDGGQAPTGLAGGTTLYFVDADGRLQPSTRDTRRLGTVLGAVQLLMSGPAGSEAGAGLHSEVPDPSTAPAVVDAGSYVKIHLPFSRAEIGADGVDQVVCTATAVVVASGRDPSRVDVSVILTSGEELIGRCPVIG